MSTKLMTAFGSSDNANETEAMYEEILTGLFGRAKKIVVEDKATRKKVEIDRISLKNLYKPLKLSSFVFKKVIQAHNDVLETGIRTGNERVIVLDMDTGNLIDDKTESPNQVRFEIPVLYRGSIITIHNNPNNTPPSPTDLYTFNKLIQIKSSVVQAHNGSLYALEKTKRIKYMIEEKEFEDNFDKLLRDKKNTNNSLYENLEIFVKRVSNLFKWDYRKE